ncbi:hypothetical protein [Micromonospora sp. SH-82]|uniref:hypothetical protein n=1 Tax=Micromonospora sp. SH-82 TaxID=3132938 RepID=UPI003EBFF8C3
MTDPWSIPGRPAPLRVTEPEPDLGSPWAALTPDEIAALDRSLGIDQTGEVGTTAEEPWVRQRSGPDGGHLLLTAPEDARRTGTKKAGQAWVEEHRRYRDALIEEEQEPSRSWATKHGHQPSHDRLANIRKGQVKASPEEEFFLRESPGFRASAPKYLPRLGADWAAEHERYRDALGGQAPSHRWAVDNDHRRSQTRLVNLRSGRIVISPEEIEFFRKAPEFREAFLPEGSRGRERYDDLIRIPAQEPGQGTSGVADIAAGAAPGARRIHRNGRQWAALHQAYSDALGNCAPNADWAAHNGHHASHQRLVDLRNGRKFRPEETELLQRSRRLLDHFFPARTPQRRSFENAVGMSGAATARTERRRSGKQWRAEHQAYLDALGDAAPRGKWAKEHGHHASHQRLLDLGNRRTFHPQEIELLQQSPKLLDHYFPQGTRKRAHYEKSLTSPPEVRTRQPEWKDGQRWGTDIRAYLDALGDRTPDEEWARANGHDSSHRRLERLGREGTHQLHPQEFDILAQRPRIIGHFYPAGTIRRDRFDTLVQQMTDRLRQPTAYVAPVAAMPVPGLHRVSGAPSARPPADRPTLGRPAPYVPPQR